VQFQNEKNGYKKADVDEYINNLNRELAQWKTRCLKAENEYFKLKNQQDEIEKNGENVTMALTAAIEKAKQIENSSKNVYKLKIQQISLLYDRWELLLNEMVNKHPNLEDSHNIKHMLEDFKKSIENVIKQDVELAASSNYKNDPMRALLAKMSNQNQTKLPPKTKKLERNLVSKDLHTGQTELGRIEEKASMIKPITNLKLQKDDEYETLADKFLTEDFDDNLQYSSFLSKKDVEDEFPYPNESGFDLKEAVNPKDDLSEIMRSFDFYNENDN